MPLLLPIKWFVLQTLIFMVMVVLEAAIVHYIEGISKRNSMIYMLIVNLFSFSFGWFLVTIAFYGITESAFRDELLSYMLLGTLSETLLADISWNPLENQLLLAMTVYFWAICFFELKLFTVLRRFVLPLAEVQEEKGLSLPPWLRWLLMVVLAQDLRLVATLFTANFISHVAVGGLIYLAQ